MHSSGPGTAHRQHGPRITACCAALIPPTSVEAAVKSVSPIEAAVKSGSQHHAAHQPRAHAEGQPTAVVAVATAVGPVAVATADDHHVRLLLVYDLRLLLHVNGRLLILRLLVLRLLVLRLLILLSIHLLSHRRLAHRHRLRDRRGLGTLGLDYLALCHRQLALNDGQLPLGHACNRRACRWHEHCECLAGTETVWDRHLHFT